MVKDSGSKMSRMRDFGQRLRISDVCRSVAEANMGRGSARAEPDIRCYTPRAVAIAEARVQRGATERSEFKKYFSIKFILIGFFIQ